MSEIHITSCGRTSTNSYADKISMELSLVDSITIVAPVDLSNKALSAVDIFLRNTNTPVAKGIFVDGLDSKSESRRDALFLKVKLIKV